MNHNNNQANAALTALNCSVTGQSIVWDVNSTTGPSTQTALATSGTTNAINTAYYGDPPNTLWGYWQQYYYPQVIVPSYPVYLQDRAMDKGKQAFEILKALMDKNLVKCDKVKDFVDAMDTILKTL